LGDRNEQIIGYEPREDEVHSCLGKKREKITSVTKKSTKIIFLFFFSKFAPLFLRFSPKFLVFVDEQIALMIYVGRDELSSQQP